MTDALERRLRRAIRLDCVSLGDAWLVTGGAQPHHVTLQGACDCYDSLYRVHADPSFRCKHQLRVALAEGDARAWSLLRAALPLPTRSRRTARR